MDKPLKLHNMNHLTIIIELTSTLHKKLEILVLGKIVIGLLFPLGSGHFLLPNRTCPNVT
jgi:hypothetical protein